MEKLIAILDAYDEDLFDAVGTEGHLAVPVAERMRYMAGQLERGEITPRTWTTCGGRDRRW